MTDLWYMIKRNDYLRFETLKCPEIVLKFTKNCPEISLLPAGTPQIRHSSQPWLEVRGGGGGRIRGLSPPPQL